MRPYLVPTKYKDYFVDDEGNVYSTRRHHGEVFRKMKPVTNSQGYQKVMICHTRKIVSVHDLVCTAFHGDRPSKSHQVRHLDGNKANNSKGNLSWGTAKDNCEDKRKHGTIPIGSRHWKSKLTESDVYQIKKLLCSGLAQKEVGRRLGVGHRTIHMIAKGRHWKHVEVISKEAKP